MFINMSISNSLSNMSNPDYTIANEISSVHEYFSDESSDNDLKTADLLTKYFILSERHEFFKMVFRYPKIIRFLQRDIRFAQVCLRACDTKIKLIHSTLLKEVPTHIFNTIKLNPITLQKYIVDTFKDDERLSALRELQQYREPLAAICNNL